MYIIAQAVHNLPFVLGVVLAFVALWTGGLWQNVRALRRERQILVTPLEVLAVEYRSEDVAVSRQADARRMFRREVGTLIVMAVLCLFTSLFLVDFLLSLA
jgi:hypothetical protein